MCGNTKFCGCDPLAKCDCFKVKCGYCDAPGCDGKHTFEVNPLHLRGRMIIDPLNQDLAKGGVKYDSGKERLELIPPELLFSIGKVLTYGAKKYKDRNWEVGMSWSRVFGALMRHMWAWWGGLGPTTENFVFGVVDEETKFSHLWHAGCCIAFLIAYEERKVGEDDRWKSN
jgi:hypothetical protein